MAVCDGKKRFFLIQIFAILYIRINFITQNNERLVILGDAAYPALLWLGKPWPGVNLSLKKELFNFRHSSARIEKTFGLLKPR